MRIHIIVLHLFWLLLAGFLAPDPLAVLAAQRLPAESEKPVVCAVMFWTDTCGHCKYVRENVLPPLQAQYGEQFELLSIQLVSSADVDRLYATAAAFGIPDAQVGVPFLLIGDQALIGSDQVEERLPGLIESYLAAGGVDFPRTAALEGLLPTEEPAGAAAAAPAQGAGERIGFILANAILVGMAAATVYVVFVLTRAGRKVALLRSAGQADVPDPVTIQQKARAGKKRSSRARRSSPALAGLAIPILAIAGMGVAAYLAYVETQAVPALCGPIGDCNAVQSSPYARLFGVLPVGELGLIGYTAILGAWFLGRFGGKRLARYASIAVLGVALAGTLFSIYLTFLEPYVIKAVCAWCLSSAVVITVLLLLSARFAKEKLT
jgi:uncharacterized membrane protein